MGYRPACWRQGVQKPFQPATGQKAANSALGHEILKLFGTETQAVQYELLICLQKAAERPCIDATQSALCGRLCRYYQPPSRDCSSSTKKPAWEPKTNHRSPDLSIAKTVAARRRCFPSGCRDEDDRPEATRPRTPAPRRHVDRRQHRVDSTEPVRLRVVRSDDVIRQLLGTRRRALPSASERVVSFGASFSKARCVRAL
jgi:hypothetical protein